MNPSTIFILQFTLSLIVFALFTKWYLTPWLANKSIHTALIVLIFPHAMRHIGLSFLVPGLTDRPPATFATMAAYGDFASGLLAILCLIALRRHWGLALPLVWIFNLVGTVDLANALRQVEVIPHLSVTWFIPTFLVPILLITHGLIFTRLFNHARQASLARMQIC